VFDDTELPDVAIEFLQALRGPGRHDALYVALRNAEFLFENLPVLERVEQAEG